MEDYFQRKIEYPLDGALRGYFCDRDVDVLGAPPSPRGLRKNLDFLRLKDVALGLLGPLAGKTILDVGCADGAGMVYCGLQGATVAGQDLSDARVESANKALLRFGLKGQAVVGDARQLNFPAANFDGAIASDFFEHVDDLTKVEILREMLRVLKPGGLAVIKTPNLAYLHLSKWYKRMRAVFRLQNPFRIVIAHTPGTDDPQHIGLTTRWGLSVCLELAGFQNYEYVYAPLRRFGCRYLIDVLATEVPVIRDLLCEDVFCRAVKPIALSHFPD
jgi:2-polyprenyl-3-methyl-5-hydroxy-6-metoxy-1,4-benzoquinol methylase